jgi:hypothetical protein
VVGRFVLTACVLTLLVAAGCGDDAGSTAQQSPSPTVTTASVSASATVSPSASPPVSAASPAAPAPTAHFEVSGHKVAAGPRTVDAKLGSEVVLEVITDTPDELHVHGYDKKLKVVPGTPARVAFTATIAGVFEVELHSGVKLCELRVR